MTKFNQECKEILTYSECLRPAMEIADQSEASQYLADYIVYIQNAVNKEPRDDNMTAEQIAKINLGYFAGYYDNQTRERVERLFMCAHPVFGRISDNGAPTAESAFSAGMNSAI